MVLGAVGKNPGPGWCRGDPGGGQRWRNQPAAPWDPLHPPWTRSCWGSPALSRVGGAQLNIKVGGARLIIGVARAQLIIGVGGVQFIIKVGGAQLIISRSHCYSSSDSEGSSALQRGSISVLISTRRGGEGKHGFSSALKFSSDLLVTAASAGCSAPPTPPGGGTAAGPGGPQPMVGACSQD